MRFFIALFIVTLNLVGCATTQVGNFATAPADAYQTMVDDTVTRLTGLYPPARTCFQINQKIRDPFGALLVKSLRLKGYSVIDSPSKKIKNQIVNNAISFAYIVDSPRSPALYRVSIMIGCNAISRAYAFNQGHLYPSGSWAYKE